MMREPPPLLRYGELTLNPLNGGEVPAGVVTVNVRAPIAAVELIAMVMVRLVSVLLPIEAVTPLPLNTTDAAPDKY